MTTSSRVSAGAADNARKRVAVLESHARQIRDVEQFQVKAFFGRQGFCVRECSTPPGNEIAAAVTRSHPATPAHPIFAPIRLRAEDCDHLRSGGAKQTQAQS
jgi:hypothetical protein